MAEKRYYVDLNISGQQLKNVSLERLPSHPTGDTAYEGRMYYNTTNFSIYYHSDSTWIQLGTDSFTVTEDVTSTIITDFGAIKPGDIVHSGTTLTEFIKQCIQSTFYPTYTAPSMTLAATGLASIVEAGTTGNTTLTSTLNKGSINGKTVGGIWQPATFQDYRSGDATKYIINGTDFNLTNSTVLSGNQILLGSNTWTGATYYSAGPQPVDSTGANYQTPLASGLTTASATIIGQRKYFQGTTSVVSPVIYTTSAQIRSLPVNALNPVNGTAFAINIPAGATMVVFAYPATLRDVSTVKYVEGLNAEVKGIFTQTTVSVEGANAYSAISYKVYSYIPAVAFTSTATYNVTI